MFIVLSTHYDFESGGGKVIEICNIICHVVIYTQKKPRTRRGQNILLFLFYTVLREDVVYAEDSVVLV